MSEKTVVFVGEKRCGKSSLIAKFLDEPIKEDMNETTGIDYRFGMRYKDERRQKVNIYELGGGRKVENLLQAPLNAFNIANTTVCIVVDLSAPGNVLDSLVFWINAVKENIEKALNDLKAKNPNKVDAIMEAHQEKWNKHEDFSRIKPSVLPIVIVGSKFDIFANSFESIKKK